MLGLWDALGHVANVFYSCGYALRDMLWLRLFLFAGCAMEMLYSFRVAENPLWVNIFWAGVGAALNGYALVLLYRERRLVGLTEEEAALFRSVFRGMTYGDFRRVVSHGRWWDVPSGTVLTTYGEPVKEVVLFVRGQGTILVEDKLVGRVSDGHFVGEMSFLVEGNASATVVTDGACRCLAWEKTLLRRMVENDPRLGAALQSVFTANVVMKLADRNRSVVEGLRAAAGREVPS